jgi:hypothetical protein
MTRVSVVTSRSCKGKNSDSSVVLALHTVFFLLVGCIFFLWAFFLLVGTTKCPVC